MTTKFTLAPIVGLFFCLPLSAVEIRGVIKQVDLEKNEVQLSGLGKARGETLTIVVASDTQILFGKQSGLPTNLAAGKIVRVEYELREDQRVASIIHVHGPKPKSEKTPVVTAEKDAITGILRRVALTDSEVVVIGPGAKGKETETTIAVVDSTKIVKGGQAVKLEELKEEDQVSIRAEKRDGRMTATMIQVGPSAAVAEKSTIVPKIRLAIRIADYLLQKMEK